MGRRERPKPLELAPGWPDEPSADPVGEVARQFALNLRDALAGESARSAAARFDLDHVTLLAILGGRSWPDMQTIAKIELALDTDLWPRRDPATGVG